jgi:competence protein ComEC
MLRPRTKWFLACALFALPTAAGTAICLPLAAAFAAASTLFAALAPVPWRRAGLAALPALLGAMQPTLPPPDLPRPGPVLVRGVVTETVHDPVQRTVWLRLAAGATPLGITCPAPVAVLPGDHVSALACLAAPQVPGGGGGLGTVAAAIAVRPAPPSLPRLLRAARAACERELLRILPDARGATLATLVLGRATRAPAEIAEAHRATGLSHLLAVSGAHAAMLGLLLGLGGGGRGRRLATRRSHLAAALLLLFAYAGITGGEPPVVRAVVMYALAALAVQTGRRLELLAGLLVPALITAQTAPAALGGPSFLLSYAAVFGLALAHGPRHSALARWVGLPLAASFWATCTTAPLTLWWFGQIAPWTILLTPLLAPLVAVLLLLGLLAALLGNLEPDLATACGPLLGALTDLYTSAVALADELPATPLRARCVPPGWLLLLVALIAGLLVWLRPRRSSIAAAVAVFATPWLVPLPRPPAPRFCLFAVGHGQAALLETAAGRRLAIDCGSTWSPPRAARALAEALTVRALDWLVVTHGDADHQGGIPYLLQRVAVRAAILPAALADTDLAARLRAHGAFVHLLRPGQSLQAWPEVAVRAPLLPASASSNDASLWIAIDVAGTRILLTGDAAEAGTRAALAQGLAPPSAVLVLPHHGRANAAAPDLLRAVAPRLCLASAASGDGETALGTLARGSGADLWVTGLHGDLTVDLGPVPTVRGSAPRPLPRPAMPR